LNLVDFIFVETNLIEPSSAEEETQSHDEQEHSGLIAHRACDIWMNVRHCYPLLNMLVDPAAMLLRQAFGINPSAFTTARDEYQQPAFQSGIHAACPLASAL
jgi:hypothetical protein